MKDTKQWSRLDNAAKIFPPTASRRDPKVFRFSCELREPVQGDVLQAALDETLKAFPLYRSMIRKGLFWYYFEASGIKPVVTEESKPICRTLYSPDKPSLLFEVTYYGNRINLEIFHALADGTGAIEFLKMLIYAYLHLNYPDQLKHLHPLEGASYDEKNMDAYAKYYDKREGKKPPAMGSAYRIRGERLPQFRLGVVIGVLSTKAVIEVAHRYQATVSELFTALLMLAVYDNMSAREYRKPVAVSVPVDLRRFFPARTARNFFGVIKVAHRFDRDGTALEDVIEGCRRSFREQLTPEVMHGIVNRYTSIENHPLVKAIPLILKIPCLMLAGLWADGQDTVSLSNVGKIVMPPETEKYIRQFDVCLSTKRPMLCLCSFGDVLTVSISSPLKTMVEQRSFFRRLVDMGIAVQLTSNFSGKGDFNAML